MAVAHAQPSTDRPTLEYLLHRGPHEVASGDLAPTGIPGLLFAPQTGPRCPAVVFGHGYLQPVRRYAPLLRFLASWGFVAIAPATERGPLPSHTGLALDMRRALEGVLTAKIGRGRVTVDPHRLAVAGHGIGGGAAVLAAQAAPRAVTAVVTVAAAPVRPSAVLAAADVTAPGLHLVGDGDRFAGDEEGGAALAAAWGGPVQLRSIRRAGHLAFTDGKHWTSTLAGEKPSAAAMRTVASATAAFLMLHTAGHDQLAEEVAAAASLAGAKLVEPVATGG